MQGSSSVPVRTRVVFIIGIAVLVALLLAGDSLWSPEATSGPPAHGAMLLG